MTRYHDNMSWYDSMIWYHLIIFMLSYHGMISWYRDTMIIYHDMIQWYDIISRYHIVRSYHDTISWYHIMISWYDIISGYHSMIPYLGNRQAGTGVRRSVWGLSPNNQSIMFDLGGFWLYWSQLMKFDHFHCIFAYPILRCAQAWLHCALAAL